MIYDTSIYISTYGERISSLKNFNFNYCFKYVVLWQSSNSLTNLVFLERENIEIIILDTLGVTNSRNFAINHCKTPWLWFMDDDVIIDYLIPNRLFSNINNDKKFSFIIFDYKNKFNRTGYFNNSSWLNKFINKIKILSVGTIQIVINCDYVRSHNIFFDTNMGAGSKYPVCDEPMFLSDLIRSSDLGYFVCKDVILNHPEYSSGLNFNTEEHILSRIIAYNYIFGFPLSILFILNFYIKNIKHIKLRLLLCSIFKILN